MSTHTYVQTHTHTHTHTQVIFTADYLNAVVSVVEQTRQLMTTVI